MCSSGNQKHKKTSRKMKVMTLIMVKIGSSARVKFWVPDKYYHFLSDVNNFCQMNPPFHVRSRIIYHNNMKHKYKNGISYKVDNPIQQRLKKENMPLQVHR